MVIQTDTAKKKVILRNYFLTIIRFKNLQLKSSAVTSVEWKMCLSSDKETYPDIH